MFFEKVSNGLLHIVDKHPNKNSDSPFIKEEGEDVYFQSCWRENVTLTHSSQSQMT